MKLNSLVNILRPLIPDKITQWQRAWELADHELQTLIEKQIISTAYQIFGNYHDKILLSLPPENKSKGSINLGTVLYNKEKWPFGLTPDEIIQNTAILGRSGSGKTNVTFHILNQLIDKKIPFVFMDWKRTARHLIPRFEEKLSIYTPGRNLNPFPFNPFIVPPGIESHIYINQLLDVMTQAYTLGDGARSLLRKAIASLYAQNNHSPTVSQIIAELEKSPDTGRKGNWKITAMRALETLEFANLSSDNTISQEQLAEKLLHDFTIIELDSLTQESKKFLIPTLSLWLYYVRLRSPEREKLKLVLFIEEAHHVLHKRPQTAGETILEMLFRQCRELGIGIVVIDQHAHLLSSAALGNTYTTIFLNQKDPSDINKAAAVCQLDADEKKYFSMLPTGQGIVKLQDRWTNPIHIQFPLVKVEKGAITDDLLRRYSTFKNAKITDSGRNILHKRYFNRVPRVPQLDIPLSDEALRFINDILIFPDDGVKQRYQRIHMSVGSANRLKTHLIMQGWLESQTIELGQTRKTALRLTPQAQSILNITQSTSPQNGSIEHEYWKCYYAKLYQDHGYQIQLEVTRTTNGRTDLVAEKDNQKIAIEIETGKSDFLSNLRQNLTARYPKIQIIATTKKAFTYIEKILLKENLLIPNRVYLNIANELDIATKIESNPN